MAAVAFLSTGEQKRELKFMPFGEYLVERAALTRQQLYVALVFQDRRPGVRIGEVVATLGFVDYEQVQTLLAEFLSIAIVEVD